MRRHGFPSQNALAVSLGLSRATITSFFNGKRIAHVNFIEISERLGLNWEEIVYKEDLDNPDIDSKLACIPNTTGELDKMGRKMLLAKSRRELQAILYEIDEFLARYPQNAEARLLKDSVKKAILLETLRLRPIRILRSIEEPESLEVRRRQVQKPTLLRPSLKFLLILLTTAGLLYLLYIFVRWTW
jgi:hypothetical protein